MSSGNMAPAHITVRTELRIWNVTLENGIYNVL